MAYYSVTTKEVVDQAVRHTWSIPEFQRGFVWKASQVRDLVESLWLDYPVGSLLVWTSDNGAEPRAATDAQTPSQWVVDGQQRTTALCIAYGRKPYWWGSAEEWERTQKKYDIRFDVDTREAPFFVVASAAIRSFKKRRYIPVSELITLDTNKDEDQQKLTDIAKTVKHDGLCDGMDVMEVYTRLDRVRKIRDKDVVVISVDHDLEDVVEVFSRLNSRGTRVTEADIYLGIVAARTPGWVRTTFIPYLGQLEDAGFALQPNLLFRSMTAVGAGRIRYREIPEDFWNDAAITPAWERTSVAWQNLIAHFRGFGILSNSPMPTQNALVTMVALLDKFPDAAFPPALYWFLQASRFGRYSGSGTTSLEEDLRDIHDAGAQIDALRRLVRRFPHGDPLDEEDFMRDYGDARFGRFLMYLLVYQNEAQDWDEKGHRLGFEGLDLLADFRPQWHHIFPRKFLEGSVAKDAIDALANIAVIGPSINIRISAKEPMNYIARYAITNEKLAQQFIDEDITAVSTEGYEDWLAQRADALADAGNRFLAGLRGGI